VPPPHCWTLECCRGLANRSVRYQVPLDLR
jgi:hypothetical protein